MGSAKKEVKEAQGKGGRIFRKALQAEESGGESRRRDVIDDRSFLRTPAPTFGNDRGSGGRWLLEVVCTGRNVHGDHKLIFLLLTYSEIRIMTLKGQLSEQSERLFLLS